MNSRSARLARGWVVGVFATALAALSHAVAGGGTPSPLALGVGLVFGGMLGTFALTSRPSLPRLLVAVTGTQLAFHLAFSTLGTAAPVAEHAHHTTTFTAAAAHAHPADPGMWVAHALAGVLTMALLRGAERAVWRLLVELGRLAIAALRLVAVPIATEPATASVPSSPPARPTSRHPVSAASLRGPPVPVAF